ncbi:hypothetical protein V8E53_015042 [Lactarius tabidus]
MSSTGPNIDQIYRDLCNSGGLSVLEITISDTYQGTSGQHLDGTTDVTRTLYFGTPTYPQRRTFTRMRQGHIAIDTAIFPNGTFVLQATSSERSSDTWARRYLWTVVTLDYRHGTYHGVGYLLN